MAQWLYTDYVKALLEVTPVELEQFVHFFGSENLYTEVKVYENGDREVIIANDQEQLPLSFKKVEQKYQFSGSYRIMDVRIACAMRKAMKKFKGYSIVRRVYSGFMMLYYYENGTVVKIVEDSSKRKRVIYEYTNYNGHLEWLFRNREVEKEIEDIKVQIDGLLDERNNFGKKHEIDARLKQLSHQLFLLEA